MRHRIKGRILGRNASHRRAMWRNMASSLILTLREDDDAPNKPQVPGRIITTLAKAKELRPYIEKLITLARKSLPHEKAAEQFATSAKRNSPEWKSWRESDQWNQWNQAIIPAVNARRKAFSLLRDTEAVRILFSDLGPRFEDRPGGYTRIVRIATVRLGDAGEQALIEFVGERDRVRVRRSAPVVVKDEPTQESAAHEAPVSEAPSTEVEATAETTETPETPTEESQS